MQHQTMLYIHRLASCDNVEDEVPLVKLDLLHIYDIVHLLQASPVFSCALMSTPLRVSRGAVEKLRQYNGELPLRRIVVLGEETSIRKPTGLAFEE